MYFTAGRFLAALIVKGLLLAKNMMAF
jgi:hypothetical protein